MSTLALIDIVAAVESQDGTSKGAKYEAWLVANLGYTADEAAETWGLRCSFLHQGQAYPHKRTSRLAFTAPGGALELHNLSTEWRGEKIGWIHIPLFVDEITAAVDRWIGQHGMTATVQQNLQRFARLRPEGLPPHNGHPVIA